MLTSFIFLDAHKEIEKEEKEIDKDKDIEDEARPEEEVLSKADEDDL
jgi:hypothetical protein